MKSKSKNSGQGQVSKKKHSSSTRKGDLKKFEDLKENSESNSAISNSSQNKRNYNSSSDTSSTGSNSYESKSNSRKSAKKNSSTVDISEISNEVWSPKYKNEIRKIVRKHDDFLSGNSEISETSEFSNALNNLNSDTSALESQTSRDVSSEVNQYSSAAQSEISESYFEHPKDISSADWRNIKGGAVRSLLSKKQPESDGHKKKQTKAKKASSSSSSSSNEDEVRTIPQNESSNNQIPDSLMNAKSSSSSESEKKPKSKKGKKVSQKGKSDIFSSDHIKRKSSDDNDYSSDHEEKPAAKKGKKSLKETIKNKIKQSVESDSSSDDDDVRKQPKKNIKKAPSSSPSSSENESSHSSRKPAPKLSDSDSDHESQKKKKKKQPKKESSSDSDYHQEEEAERETGLGISSGSETNSDSDILRPSIQFKANNSKHSDSDHSKSSKASKSSRKKAQQKESSSDSSHKRQKSSSSDFELEKAPEQETVSEENVEKREIEIKDENSGSEKSNKSRSSSSSDSDEEKSQSDTNLSAIGAQEWISKKLETIDNIHEKPNSDDSSSSISSSKHSSSSSSKHEKNSDLEKSNTTSLNISDISTPETTRQEWKELKQQKIEIIGEKPDYLHFSSSTSPQKSSKIEPSSEYSPYGVDDQEWAKRKIKKVEEIDHRGKFSSEIPSSINEVHHSVSSSSSSSSSSHHSSASQKSKRSSKSNKSKGHLSENSSSDAQQSDHVVNRDIDLQIESESDTLDNMEKQNSGSSKKSVSSHKSRQSISSQKMQSGSSHKSNKSRSSKYDYPEIQEPVEYIRHTYNSESSDVPVVKQVKYKIEKLMQPRKFDSPVTKRGIRMEYYDDRVLSPKKISKIPEQLIDYSTEEADESDALSDAASISSRVENLTFERHAHNVTDSEVSDIALVNVGVSKFKYMKSPIKDTLCSDSDQMFNYTQIHQQDSMSSSVVIRPQDVPNYPSDENHDSDDNVSNEDFEAAQKKIQQFAAADNEAREDGTLFDMITIPDSDEEGQLLLNLKKNAILLSSSSSQDSEEEEKVEIIERTVTKRGLQFLLLSSEDSENENKTDSDEDAKIDSSSDIAPQIVLDKLLVPRTPTSPRSPRSQNQPYSDNLLLTVTLLEANDLPKGPAKKNCDPYCLLQIKGKKDVKRTKTCRGSGKFGWADQQFSFLLNPKQKNILTIKVRDEDKFGGDADLAAYEFLISSLKINSTTEEWFNLKSLQKVDKGGKLHVRLDLKPEPETPRSPRRKDKTFSDDSDLNNENDIKIGSSSDSRKSGKYSSAVEPIDESSASLSSASMKSDKSNNSKKSSHSTKSNNSLHSNNSKKSNNSQKSKHSSKPSSRQSSRHNSEAAMNGSSSSEGSVKSNRSNKSLSAKRLSSESDNIDSVPQSDGEYDE